VYTLETSCGMEVESASTSVVEESAAGGGGASMALHPLVILNISDQYTRQKAIAGAGATVERVAGCIVGVPENRRIEIANSFEVPFVAGEGGALLMDIAFLRTKIEQFKKVFPHYEVLGWYSTGTGQPSASDVAVQRSLIDGYVASADDEVQEADPICERPVYLRLDTKIDFQADAKELPITAYESELRTDVGGGDKPTLMFVPVEAFRLKPESGEAERISVDHISRAGSAAGAGGASTLTTQLGGMRNAMGMLHDRVDMLQKYLADVASGKVAPNQSILREVASLCSRLPVMDPPDFFTDYNDTLLITYLCSLTQCANSTNELLDKFAVESERSHGPGGGRSHKLGPGRMGLGGGAAMFGM
jgi:COP9 signalosome complex subunit 6